MAADYAGALAAIRSRFESEWASRIPVGFINEEDPTETDPTLNSAWALFEIVSNGSFKGGVGVPGDSVIIYDGLIKVYVFVPSGQGIADVLAFALAAGEIFRNKKFYDDVTDGCYVRTGYDLQGQPRIDDGVASDEDGAWFNVTATIPFEYWHRG